MLALAVLIATGGVAVEPRRADAAPIASARLARAWQVPAPAADEELIGSWLTGRLLVRAATRGVVVAYDLSDGAVVWRSAPVAKGAVPCAMSPTVAADGVGTVAFGPDGDACTSLAGLDSATGRIRWTIPLVDAGHRTAMPAETYGQGDVATVVDENVIGGLDPRTGRVTPVARLPPPADQRPFTSGTVYVLPGGGLLELDALGTENGVTSYR